MFPELLSVLLSAGMDLKKRRRKKMDTKELYPGYGEDVRLTRVVPAPRQIATSGAGIFRLHSFYGQYLYGKGMGNGEESPLFSIRRSWMQGRWETAVRGGMTGLILTCKHHDGFCLWPSAYTEHSIKNSSL